jgi:hypothetical protein
MADAVSTPQSAVLSALIFNALIIPLLIPLALRGVHFRAETAETLFQRNLWIYGLGGLIAPFIGIKLIDLMIAPLVREERIMSDIVSGALRVSLVNMMLDEVTALPARVFLECCSLPWWLSSSPA